MVKIVVPIASRRSAESDDDEDFLSCCGVKNMRSVKSNGANSSNSEEQRPAKALRSNAGTSGKSANSSKSASGSNADDDAACLTGKSLAVVAAAKTLLTESQQFIELLGDDEGVKQLQVLATSAP